MKFASLRVSFCLTICWLIAANMGLPAAEPAPLTGKVHQVKVGADLAPDCSSLKTIVESVTRGCKTNDEKAIALYNFMQLTHYHHAYPGEKDGLGALKEMNVYGWSLCGGLHTLEAALWREMGWKWRYIGWSDPGHTTVEVFYDGRWHYLDVFLKFYAWMPDKNAPGGRTIASQEDIKNDPTLVTEGLVFDKARDIYYHKDNRFENVNDKANWRAPAFLTCGDGPQGIIQGIKSNKGAGSPTGWGGLQFDSPGYTTDVDLTPGAALTLTWDAVKDAAWFNGRKAIPSHTCGDKDQRNCPAIGPVLEPYLRTGSPRRSYANGTLDFAPDFANDAFLRGLSAQDNLKLANGQLVPADPTRPASLTVELQSPYVMTRATGAADGVDQAELSLDHGKTFKPIKLEDFSEAVGGEYACQVRMTFKKALKSLKFSATVQHNRCSLPYLSPGKNKITVSVAEPRELGEQRLVVTYAYETGFRTKSYEELADEGAELARSHNAIWSTKPTVVQKVFTAKDLPAIFDIDVPTPSGKYPVYPRMLFVRRELLAPGAQPLALPEGAEAPKVSKPEELQSLPNPFTVGIAVPPKKAVRPTTTRTLTLQTGPVVSKDGKAEENHYLKWKDGDTWVLLVGGELKELPPAKEIAAARLIFPVLHGHDKAATKTGVTLLQSSYEKGQPFDFKQLGDVTSTIVVPRQPSADVYDPAKKFAIDVTRAVKQVAAGEVKFRGFGLRVIQDRGVDEGYLIRLDLPKNPTVQLEIDIYDKK